MYISSDTSKFLNLIYSSYHFKPLYSKELKERIVSIVRTEIEALNRNFTGFDFLKELDKFFIFKDGELFQIKEDYFLLNKDFLINSLNPIWFSNKEIKKSKNRNLMKLKLYLFLKKEDSYFLRLFTTKELIILNKDFDGGRHLSNEFFISNIYKEKTCLKKLANIEFDEKEWNKFKNDFIELSYLFINFNYTHRRLRKIYGHLPRRKEELENLGLSNYIINSCITIPSEELFNYTFVENSGLNSIKDHLVHNYSVIEKIKNFL